MTDDDWDNACHLCGSLRCGCTPEDLANWRASLVCPRCGRRKSKSAGCPDTCNHDRTVGAMVHVHEPHAEQVFTEDQVASLNAYQVAGVMHPFTCGHRDHSVELVAYPEGWRCPVTGAVVQLWAHKFMADWSWAGMDRLGRTWDRDQGKWK